MRQSVLVRVRTAVVLLIPVLLLLFIANPWPVFFVALGTLWLMARELGRMVDDHPLWIAAWGLPVFVLLAGWLADVGPLAPIETGPFLWACLVVTFVGATALIVWGRHRDARYLPAGLWLAGPLAALVVLHGLNARFDAFFQPASPLFLAMVPVWVGDTAAFFFGKAFGRRKLAPTLSPKKTVEGAIANAGFCVMAAWLVGLAIGIPAPAALLAGAVMGTLGQVGDLFESWIKRTSGRKDSGSLLPGHGGLLDRMDSILFTAPVVALIVHWWRP